MEEQNLTFDLLDGDFSPESADGTLVIIVCRAKHLPNRRKLDKQSPYVTLRMGTTAKKTPSDFRAGQIPEWTHEIRFQLTRGRKPVMRLDVLDETKGDPTPVGSAEIDCSVVFSNPENLRGSKYIYDKWHELSLNGRRAGLIYLEMTFYPTAPVLPPKVAAELAYDGQEVVEEGHHNAAFHEKSLPPPPPKHPSRAHPPNVADEVFVSGDAKKSLKRLSFLRNSVGSHGSGTDEEKVDAPKETTDKKSKSKFGKFKSKFQTKESISHLWQGKEEQQAEPQKPDSRTSSISEFESTYHERTDSNPHYHHQHSPSKQREFQSPFGKYELLPEVYDDESPEDSKPAVPRHRYVESPGKSPTRKPPQNLDGLEPSLGDLSLNHPTSTAVPFSADTIGVDEEDDHRETMPTKVYLFDQPIKSLTHSGKINDKEEVNPDEIDPKYYAPTPNEHLQQNPRRRLDYGLSDTTVDLRTKQTGYLGNGRWETDAKYSPSAFDRVPKFNDENLGFENKPNVPPKIPKGMTEKEYYVLERDKYLKDVNGRRA